MSCESRGDKSVGVLGVAVLLEHILDESARAGLVAGALIVEMCTTAVVAWVMAAIVPLPGLCGGPERILGGILGFVDQRLADERFEHCEVRQGDGRGGGWGCDSVCTFLVCILVGLRVVIGSTSM